MGRVDKGDCSPKPLADPDMRLFRIRLLTELLDTPILLYYDIIALGAHNWVPCGNHVIESCPIIASLLTSPIQPIKQTVKNLKPERHNFWVISQNPIVMEIADQHLIDPLDDVYGLFIPHHADLTVHFFAFLSKFLSTCRPPYPELPAFIPRAGVCESEEIERLRLTLSTLSAIIFREPPEFDKPTLLFRQTKSKIRHPMFQSLIELLRFIPVLEADHEIIGVVYYSCISL